MRNEREILGLKQKEFAEKLNIPPNTYNGYETGKRTPSLDILKEIAEHLNISIDYLLGKSNIKSHDNVKKYDDNQSDLPDKFTTAQDAIKYILKQPTLMAYGNCDIESLDEEDLIDFANDLLEQFKLLSYKYKK